MRTLSKLPLQRSLRLSVAALLAICLIALSGCSFGAEENGEQTSAEFSLDQLKDIAFSEESSEEEPPAGTTETVRSSADELRSRLNLSEDYRTSFDHGPKGAEYQKYIVLHDTEGEGSASGVIDWWDSNGNAVAAHFIINKDGSIVQCVPLDRITHHAGYGDAGHNELYGVTDESRDDKVGTTSIGKWAPDYGMNSYSIGIEMVHVGGSGSYPAAQLEALDNLIAYIDAYYGFESEIIDHKAWRTGNSDTSAEFAQYLKNYQATRTHDGAKND